jgi:cytochrome P450
VGEVTGMGLVFAEGDEHKKQRKLLNGMISSFEIYMCFWIHVDSF